MALTLIHVDDSGMQLKIAKPHFVAVFPEHEVLQFNSVVDFIAWSEANPDRVIDIIFSDNMMPVITGLQFTQWLKRSPRFHMVPMIMITAELDLRMKQEAIDQGVFDYLPKPLHREEVEKVRDKLKAHHTPPEAQKEFVKNFTQQGLEQMELIHSLKKELNQISVSELKRIMHTLKGDARSLEFREMGRGIHLTEDLLTAISEGGLYQFPPVLETLAECVSWLEKQFESIHQLKQLEEFGPELAEKIKGVKFNVANGWRISTPAAEAAQAAAQSASSQGQGGDGKDAAAQPERKKIQQGVSSVRISHEYINELQSQFQSILQDRLKLNRFAMQLKQEFDDEVFPRDLVQMVEQLNADTMKVVDFFISLRMVPTKRVEEYSKRIVQQVSSLTEKPVDLVFKSENGLEIDQMVAETLEGALLHLLRNCIDHGIEKQEIRSQKMKNIIGTIEVQLTRDLAQDQVFVKIQDDGGGIDLNRLKDSVASRGVIARDELDKLNEEQVCDLIFVDGVSTRDQVTEISGRGVGLSAVRENIEKLGGNIRVSRREIGTQFEIQLPRVVRK